MTDAHSSKTEDVAFPSPADIRDACALLPGAPVLDVDASTIQDYACGTFALVERDARSVLGEATAAAVLAWLSEAPIELRAAFGLRNELCNLKKCIFFVFQQASNLERQLSQLATFFHGEHQVMDGGNFWVHSARLEALSDARTRAKGACAGVADARSATKHCCSIARHPSKDPPTFLRELPSSLQAWRIATAALDAVKGDDDNADQSAGDADAVIKAACDDARATARSSHASAQAAFRARAARWPPHAVAFVDAVVLCRGGDKALRIRDEAKRVEVAISHTLALLEHAASALGEQPDATELARRLSDSGGESARAALSRAMRLRKHANLVDGCLPVMRDTLQWFESAAEAAERGATRFVAGDGRQGEHTQGGRASRQLGFQPALCVGPSAELHGHALFTGLADVERRFRPEMRAVIAADGWPASIASRRGAERSHVADNKFCCYCERQFSALWVLRGCCSECEARVRDEGRCPFSERCSTAWFCPHDRKCFVCDNHSCELCRFERGNAECVAEVADRLARRGADRDGGTSLEAVEEDSGGGVGGGGCLQRICLDFDRTLATTRSGGEPVVGKHTLDDELCALMWTHHGRCSIVTRNSHRDAIGAFLAAHGAPPHVPIHVVSKGQSKSDVVLAGLAGDGHALVVDDSVAELVDQRLADDRRVHRVLFVRALL